MAPPRKGASQAATAATSKVKLMVAGGAGPANAHRHHLDVHIEDVGENHSSLATVPKAGTNGNETRLPAEGQLL